MLVSDIITDIKNHGFDDLSNATLLNLINDTYQDINTIEAWPYLEKLSSVTAWSAGSVTQFSAVTDIKQVLSLVNVTQGYELTPIDPDIFYKQYVGTLTQTGDPILYYTPTINPTAPNGWSISVWPAPPAGTCQLRYLYIPVMLTSLSDVPVLPERFHRILVKGTLAACYTQEDDPDSALEMQNQYDRQLMRMRNDLWGQNFDRNDTIGDVNGDQYWDGY